MAPRNKRVPVTRLARGENFLFCPDRPRGRLRCRSHSHKGVLCKGLWQGEEWDRYPPELEQRYITLAPRATVLGLAFKLYDPDHLMGDVTEYGITGKG